MTRSSGLRRFAALAALVGWFALTAQFYLSVQLGIANGNGGDHQFFGTMVVEA